MSTISGVYVCEQETFPFKACHNCPDVRLQILTVFVIIVFETPHILYQNLQGHLANQLP